MVDGRSGNETLQWIGMGPAMRAAIKRVIRMAIARKFLVLVGLDFSVDDARDGSRHTWPAGEITSFRFSAFRIPHSSHDVSINGGAPGMRTSTTIIRPW